MKIDGGFFPGGQRSRSRAAILSTLRQKVHIGCTIPDWWEASSSPLIIFTQVKVSKCILNWGFFLCEINLLQVKEIYKKGGQNCVQLCKTPPHFFSSLNEQCKILNKKWYLHFPKQNITSVDIFVYLFTIHYTLKSVPVSTLTHGHAFFFLTRVYRLHRGAHLHCAHRHDGAYRHTTHWRGHPLRSLQL